MHWLRDKRVYLQHGRVLHKSIWTLKLSPKTTNNFQSPKPAIKLFYQRTHMAEMTKPYEMESLLKDHREEESAVWKIGLCWECEEWICSCFGDHQAVVGAARPHRRPSNPPPPMNRWTARRRKQRRWSRLWTLHVREAVIRNNRGMDNRDGSNTLPVCPPACLSVCLSPLLDACEFHRWRMLLLSARSERERKRSRQRRIIHPAPVL